MNGQNLKKWLDDHGNSKQLEKRVEQDDQALIAMPTINVPRPEVHVPDMPDVHVPRPSVNVTSTAQSTIGYAIKHFALPIGVAYLLMQATFGTMSIWGYLPGFTVLFSTAILSGWLLQMMGVLSVATRNLLSGIDFIVYGIILMMVPGLFYTHFLHLQNNYRNLIEHKKEAQAMGLEKAYGEKKHRLEKRLGWWSKRFATMNSTLQDWQKQQRVETLTYSDEELTESLSTPEQLKAARADLNLPDAPTDSTEASEQLPLSTNVKKLPEEGNEQKRPQTVAEAMAGLVFAEFEHTPADLRQSLNQSYDPKDRAGVTGDEPGLLFYRLYDQVSSDALIDTLTDEQRSTLTDSLDISE